MTAYTLSFELRADSTPTPPNAGDGTTCGATLNGTDLGTFGPVLQGGTTCVANWHAFSVDVSGLFDPMAANHLRLFYVSGNDRSHWRRIKVTGDDGSVYYGEYPAGFPYTEALQDGIAGSDSCGGDLLEMASDGESPAEEWNVQTGHYVTPSEGDDAIHLYFSIPTIASFDWAPANSLTVQASRISIDRSRKTAAAQLDADFSNEHGEKGYYTQSSRLFVPGNQIRAYLWLGDRANRVLRFTGLISRPTEHRDPKTVSLKALSRTAILLDPHKFLTIAPQDAATTGAIRTEANGVFLNKSPEYIANYALDQAGWPSADRDIQTTGITIPEYDFSDGSQWLDQIVGTDRLTTIAGWDYREDAAGVIHLQPSPLADVSEPDPDWTFTPGVNVMAFDHQADDEARVTRVRVSGPMTSSVPIWKQEWATSVISHPTGMMYVAAESAYIYVIDGHSNYLSKISQATHKVVKRWALGGSITYQAAGLTVDEGADRFYVLDADWPEGGTTHAKVQKFVLSTKAHVATYSLPDGQWSAIKTDGTYLWLTNYGDDKLYRRTLTATASASYSYAGKTNPTGLYIDGTTIGIHFAAVAAFYLVDTSAPGTITGTQSTKGTDIFGGEMDTTTHADLYVDHYTSSSGSVQKFALTEQVTSDVVKWAYDQALEDDLGIQSGIADRVHDLHPLDAAHPFDIRIATIELRTVNSPAQAQAVADAQLALRRRIRRVLDLATTGHPGVEIADIVDYPDVVSAAPTPWMVDTLREQLAETYTQTMSVLPWEAPA